MFAYSWYIQLQFLKISHFTDVCNLLPVLIYIAFRRVHPDNATMVDVKKALSDDNIDFSQLKYWNADRCLELSVG
jgi:hypothetical protein